MTSSLLLLYTTLYGPVKGTPIHGNSHRVLINMSTPNLPYINPQTPVKEPYNSIPLRGLRYFTGGAPEDGRPEPERVEGEGVRPGGAWIEALGRGFQNYKSGASCYPEDSPVYIYIYVKYIYIYVKYIHICIYIYIYVYVVYIYICIMGPCS